MKLLVGVGVSRDAIRFKTAPTTDLSQRLMPTMNTQGPGLCGGSQWVFLMPSSEQPNRIVTPTTLSDVRSAEGASGLVAVGTFSGGGGSSTGYKLAGFSVPAVVEFVPAAQAAYAVNHPATTIIQRDIRTVTPDELVEAAGGHVDVLEGSPPCTAYSTLGKRTDGWDDEHDTQGITQRSDDLLIDWLRFVDGIQPRAFAAENVPSLITGGTRAHFDEFIHRARSMGYTVQAAVLTASDFGVPQARRRLFIVGFKDAADAQRFTWPTPTNPLRSAADTILAYNEQPGDPVYTPTSGKIERTNRRIRYVATRDRWVAAHLDEFIDNPHTATIRASTIRAISGFPVDYNLGDTLVRMVQRSGNAVPPPLAQAVATSIRRALTNH